MSVFITTAVAEFPRLFDAKFHWLAEHLPFINPMNIVFCGNKSILKSDYLIDYNLCHFTHFNGKGILFSPPHNQKISGFTRVHRWANVEEMFLYQIQ